MLSTQLPVMEAKLPSPFLPLSSASKPEIWKRGGTGADVPWKVGLSLVGPLPPAQEW